MDVHISVIRRFFDFCVKYNVKLNPAKCSFFSTSICWCGCVISQDGIRFDSLRINGIRNMSSPETGADTQQFICAMQWMCSSIPDFYSAIHPLAKFLKNVYKTAGKRTRLAVAGISLQFHH